MAQEVEKLAVSPQAEAAPSEEPRGGITPAAVAIGAAILLALAWSLPHWTMTKSYRPGMGTYLPIEAVILTLVLALFNRFGGKVALAAGVAAAAWLTPYWHGAVYTKTAAAAKMLPAVSEWFYVNCAGLIEPAQKSEWTPSFLVAAGALAAFVAGALPAWLVSAAVPGLRRKLVWRELLVVFVLVTSGIYSCFAVQFLVGTLTVPYKDDDRTRDFKRFYRPVPYEQDPGNAAGIPSKLVPYDPSDFDLAGADPTSDEGKAVRAAAAEEKEALDRFRKGINKSLPDPDKVEALLAEADAARSWLQAGGRSGAGAGAEALAGALDAARAKLQGAVELKVATEALDGLQKAVDQATAAKAAADKAAGRAAEPFKTEAAGDRYRGQGRALLAKVREHEKGLFLSHWRRPLAWWLPLLALLLLGQVFLAAMLRRQWTDHEKLMFPHAEAMRALAEGADLSSKARRVFSSPLLWIGVGLSAALFLFQGLNHYFPSVPAPDLQKISLNTFISERPWTAMQRDLNLQSYLLGLSYLLANEVALSIWVFGIVNQALRVACSAWGLPQNEGWAVTGEWANSDALYTGAILIFVGWLGWSARRHIWYVLRRGLGLVPADTVERAEPMGYPTAFWGFWLSAAGVLGWCALAGLKVWVMAVLFGLFLVLVALISRLVAEVGLITAGAEFWPFYPQFVFSWVFGFGQGAAGKLIAYKDSYLGAGGTLIPVTLRAASVWSFIWPSMLHTIPLTPVLLTSFKLTETEPRRKRLLTWLMVGAVALGAVIFLQVTLSTIFERGAQSVELYAGKNVPNWVFANWLMRDMVNKERMWSPDFFRLAMMAVGGVTMGALLVFRGLFYWWPLHPIGMAATGIDGVWFCFLVGWILKRAALAYGGGEFSQRINSLFYGLILGQFIMAAFWALVGLCGTGCMPSLLPDLG